MVKSWLVQDQTVLGKDYSNLLIADSLLKTIWFINAPCYGNEALASPKANELTIPEQTATGKGTSNPFMAGIRNVSPNGVFCNEVYGGDSEGFGGNPLSDEFRLCNSDELRFINGGGPLEIRGYSCSGDMVDQRGVWIIRS
ncbi:hypothetical protein Tco_0942717 [Tanacetum coccineum]